MLFNAASVKIKRHIKRKSAANLFVRLKEVSYALKRKKGIWFEANETNKGLTKVWRKQNSIHPICREIFLAEAGYNHLHHITPGKLDGRDGLNHLIL